MVIIKKEDVQYGHYLLQKNDKGWEIFKIDMRTSGYKNTDAIPYDAHKIHLTPCVPSKGKGRDWYSSTIFSVSDWGKTHIVFEELSEALEVKELMQILEKKCINYTRFYSNDLYIIDVFQEDSCSSSNDCDCSVYDGKIIFSYQKGTNSVEMEIKSVLDLQRCLRFVGLDNIIDNLFD